MHGPEIIHNSGALHDLQWIAVRVEEGTKLGLSCTIFEDEFTAARNERIPCLLIIQHLEHRHSARIAQVNARVRATMKADLALASPQNGEIAVVGEQAHAKCVLIPPDAVLDVADEDDHHLQAFNFHFLRSLEWN